MAKSDNKRFQREQERISNKYNLPKVNPFTLGWTFNKWYEKVILIVLMVLGIWKITGWIW